jgi:hypothetical protein
VDWWEALVHKQARLPKQNEAYLFFIGNFLKTLFV